MDSPPLLVQAIADYLQGLPQGEQTPAQQELRRLLRWLGSDSTVADLTPQVVANFTQQEFPGNGDEHKGKALKDFLSYLKRKGLTSENLGKYVRTPRSTRRPKQTVNNEAQAPVHLTAEGLQRIQGELDALRQEQLALAEEVRRAAADKDVRENAPLEAARERLGWVSSRIRELEALLHQAQVMETPSVSQARRKVCQGCTVVLLDRASGREVSYALVDPRESSPLAGRISVDSPVGKALLDHYEGDEVEVRAPRGVVRYYILKVT
ncbi:MAG: GreA/GreB family elongation factor [Dehalococcoidia bacterium]